jgi:branched-chain amino acid transport system substrate-binding protein
MRRSTAALVATVAVLATALAFIATSGGETPPPPKPPAGQTPSAAQPDVLKIALISASTGWGAIYGLANKQMYILAGEEHNAQGGLLVGGKRYKIEFVPFDDQFDATLSRTIGERAVAQGIRIFGMQGDPGASAHCELSIRNKVVIVHTSTDEGTYSCSPYMISTINPFWTTYIVLMKAAKGVAPNAKRVAGIMPNQSYDYPLRDRFPKQIKANPDLGLEHVGTMLGEQGQDWSPSVNKLLALKPDIIVHGCFGAEEIAVVKLIRDGGFKGILATACSSTGDDDFIKAIGADYLEGRYVKTTPAPAPLSEATKEFHDKFISHGVKWTDFAIAYWYGPRLMFAGLQAAGTVTDPDAIMNAMRQVELPVTFVEGSPKVKVWGKQHFAYDSILENMVFLSNVKNRKFQTQDSLRPTY